MNAPLLSLSVSAPIPDALKKKRVLLIDTSHAKRDLRAEIMRKVGSTSIVRLTLEKPYLVETFTLGGRTLTINEAKPKTERPRGGGQRFGGGGGRGRDDYRGHSRQPREPRW